MQSPAPAPPSSRIDAPPTIIQRTLKPLGSTNYENYPTPLCSFCGAWKPILLSTTFIFSKVMRLTSVQTRPLTQISFRDSLTQCMPQWKTKLQRNHDKNFLLSGFTFDFSLVPDHNLFTETDCRNYQSALKPKVHPFLDELFLEELALGRLTNQPAKPHRVNAMEAAKTSVSATSLVDHLSSHFWSNSGGSAAPRSPNCVTSPTIFSWLHKGFQGAKKRKRVLTAIVTS